MNNSRAIFSPKQETRMANPIKWFDDCSLLNRQEPSLTQSNHERNLNATNWRSAIATEHGFS